MKSTFAMAPRASFQHTRSRLQGLPRIQAHMKREKGASVRIVKSSPPVIDMVKYCQYVCSAGLYYP